MAKLADKKELLKQLVQEADDKLTSLLLTLAVEYNKSDGNYSAEEIQGFYQVRDQLLKEPETGYTPGEAHDLIRKKNTHAI